MRVRHDAVGEAHLSSVFDGPWFVVYTVLDGTALVRGNNIVIEEAQNGKTITRKPNVLGLSGHIGYNSPLRAVPHLNSFS
jgi:hypothetical protein